MALKTRPNRTLDKMVDRIKKVAVNTGRRDAEDESKFRRAIGNTSLEWLDNLKPAERSTVLYALLVTAKAGDRRQIAQHEDCDDALIARVDAELARRAAEAEAAKAAKAAAAADAASAAADDAA